MSSVSGHGSTAERDQHVANQYARQRRRSLRFERKNDQTFLMIGQLDGLQTDAQVAARHASAGEHFVDDPVDGGRGNGQPRDARQRGSGDPESLTRGVQHQPAGRTRIERQIETDVAVQAGRPARCATGRSPR